MSGRNVIQVVFDEFGREVGGVKRSGSWYCRTDETVFVLNLQKSNYATRYYVNVAVWLLAAGPADAPKPSHCQIQTRLGRLVPADSGERLEALLDLESGIADGDRRADFLGLMRDSVQPLVVGASTLEGLRSGGGRALVAASLVDGDGLRLLAGG